LTQNVEGGKTGLTAIFTGLAFFVSIFFSPIFASIPPWATGGALVIVGTLMVRKYVSTRLEGRHILIHIASVLEINWNYLGDAVPAFLTLIMIPLTYKCVLLFPVTGVS
jgi:AGZA family xanthine/uracil permease-like MFS transporter